MFPTHQLLFPTHHCFLPKYKCVVPCMLDYNITSALAVDRDFVDINSGEAPTWGPFGSVWGALELPLVILGGPLGHLGALGAHIRDLIKL